MIWCKGLLISVFMAVLTITFSTLLFSSNLFAQSGEWLEKMNMPTARWGHASCTVDGKIYVMGGSDAKNDRTAALSVVEVYDPISDSWDVSKAPMNFPRVGFMAAAVDGVIYAIGGRPIWNLQEVATVEAYDTKSNTWSVKSSMPHPRSRAGCCVQDSKIYIIGGSKNFLTWTQSDDLQIYDPATDTWDPTKAKMHNSRGGLHACISNEKVYAIGGYNYAPWPGLETIEVYDKNSDVWVLKTKLKQGRYSASVHTINNLLYIIGGQTKMDPVYSVEVYDPEKDNCQIIDQTPIWFSLQSSSIYNTEIYIFGGSTTGEGNNLYQPSNKVYSYIIEPVSVGSSADEIPQKFALEQSYPNPFNPNTKIKYSIPTQCKVVLKVFDVLGKEVKTLISEELQPGKYETEFDASTVGLNLASGTYFYRLSTEDFAETKKMILIK